jgi:DNA-binding NtrC family response regulator
MVLRRYTTPVSNGHTSAYPLSDRTTTGTHEGWLATRSDSPSPAPVHAVVESQRSPRAIHEALARHAGNQSKAYAELGLPSRFALYRLLRKHGIDARDPERER